MHMICMLTRFIFRGNLGALIIRIGFWWGLLCYNYIKGPPKPIRIIKAPTLDWTCSRSSWARVSGVPRAKLRRSAPSLNPKVLNLPKF